MYELISTMYVEASHFLEGHPGKCAYTHGHSYRIRVHFESNKLKDGMIIDFSDMKKIMFECIDIYDHAFIVDYKTDTAEILAVLGDMKLAYISGRPTAENMAKTIFNDIADYLPEDVRLSKVCVRETRDNEACYYEK